MLYLRRPICILANRAPENSIVAQIGQAKEVLRTRPVVSYLHEMKLKLLIVDKEDGFVAFPEGLLGETSKAAILKNSRQVDKVSLNNIKTAAKVHCEGLGLNRLAKKVQPSQKLSL